jgi:hypothetical protein
MFRRRSKDLDHPADQPGDGGAPDGIPAGRWLTKRGTPLVELSADVIGSFPGFADHAGLIVDATVVLTDHYLLVDEGEPHGFALAVPHLDRARADDGEVRVGFRQDGDRRSFLLRVRRSRRSPRPRTAASGLLAALRSCNISGEFPSSDLGQSTVLSWDDASAVEHERVRWTGRATAPIAVGQECTPSDLWVSLESLLWTSPRAKGVNRLGLGAIVAVSPAEITGDVPTPATYVTIGDEDGGLIDLPFIFNLAESLEDNSRDRTVFQNRIRGDRLPSGGLPTRRQPWLSDDLIDEVVDHEGDLADDAADPEADDEPGATVAGPADASNVATAIGIDTSGGSSTDAVAPIEIPAEGQVFASWPAPEGGRGPLGSGARRPPGDRPGGLHARRWRHTRGVDVSVVPEVQTEEAVVEHEPMTEAHDVVLAEWSGAEPTRAYAAWPGVDIAIDEQPSEPQPPSSTAIPAYERAALATIDAVLFVISRRARGDLRATVDDGAALQRRAGGGTLRAGRADGGRRDHAGGGSGAEGPAGGGRGGVGPAPHALGVVRGGAPVAGGAGQEAGYPVEGHRLPTAGAAVTRHSRWRRLSGWYHRGLFPRDDVLV